MSSTLAPSSDRLDVASGPRAFELSVVVGTLNEAANIPTLLGALEAVLGETRWELVIVDDDSKDGSAELLVELARTRDNVRFIRRVGRIGLSAAVIEGMMTCASPYIAVMDADGQHDEAALPRLVELMRGGEVDLAVGSRFAPGATITGFPEERLKLSLRANSLTQRYYGVKVLDSNTGYFAIRRDAFERVVRGLSGRGFKILLDILLAGPDLRVVEIPINFRSRLEGESKLSKYVLAEYALQLYEAKLGRLVPARVILDLGLVVFFSLVTALVANALYQFAHVPPGPSILLASLPVLYGLHAIALQFMPGRKRPKGPARWRDLAFFVAVCAPFLALGFWLASGLVSENGKYLRAFFAAACAVSTGLLLATGWRKEAAARR